MEGRKWEDMNPDCLVNIFGRVELVSRVSVIPLVCKPWYQAVLNPLCWEKLIFPPAIPRSRSQTELIKFTVNRSQRRATDLSLPFVCDREVLIYVSEELPALRELVLLHGVCTEHKDIIPSVIVKWKNMESLYLADANCIKEILGLIHIHLPNLFGLCLKKMHLDGEEASAISQLPKLRCLFINLARIQKEYLMLIIQICKKLKYLDVRNYIGFDEDDEDILRLASGIKNFHCDGSIAIVTFDNLFGPIAIAEPFANIDINCKIIEGEVYQFLIMLTGYCKHSQAFSLSNLLFIKMLFQALSL